jgi:hypothetical protein
MSNQLTEDEVMHRLEQYQPTVPSDEWTSTERGMVLAAVLKEEHAPPVRYVDRSRRHRWLAIVGGVAAAAVAVLVVELVPSDGGHAPSGGSIGSPGPTANASTNSEQPAPSGGAVQRLANAARSTRLGNPQAGQYWYQRVELFAVLKKGQPPKRVGTTSNWVAPNGDDWNLSNQGARSCTFYKYVGSPNINHPNSDFLHGLPTDPRGLYQFLRTHVAGSNSNAEAMFVAIGDALHNDEGLVPPDLRAAFIEVLGRIPRVIVHDDVPYGKGDMAITFTLGRTGSLWFDQKTAQVVYESGAPTYRIVAHLPAKVASRQSCPRGSD